MTNRALIEQRLAQAREALHKLLTGASTVQLSYQGESITYSSTDEGRLRNYIRELESQLGIGSNRTRSRRVIFG